MKMISYIIKHTGILCFAVSLAVLLVISLCIIPAMTNGRQNDSGKKNISLKKSQAKQVNVLSEISKDPFPALFAPVRKVELPRKGEKVCYITFDDGPGENTEAILDILKEYEAKATFFVIGEGLTGENKPLMERIRKEGHSIGLHAYNHIFEQFYISPQSVLKDYERLHTLLREEYNIETALFRFPGGSICTYLQSHRDICLKEMEKRGFACFDWHISGEDAIGYPTVQSICQNVFSNIFNYDTPILLLHDAAVADKTVEALPIILERMQEEGYRFAALESAPEYVYSAR